MSLTVLNHSSYSNLWNCSLLASSSCHDSWNLKMFLRCTWKWSPIYNRTDRGANFDHQDSPAAPGPLQQAVRPPCPAGRRRRRQRRQRVPVRQLQGEQDGVPDRHRPEAQLEVLGHVQDDQPRRRPLLRLWQVAHGQDCPAHEGRTGEWFKTRFHISFICIYFKYWMLAVLYKWNICFIQELISWQDAVY